VVGTRDKKDQIDDRPNPALAIYVKMVPVECGAHVKPCPNSSNTVKNIGSKESGDWHKVTYKERLHHTVRSTYSIPINITALNLCAGFLPNFLIQYMKKKFQNFFIRGPFIRSLAGERGVPGPADC
jgi:hypothetical protein